MTTNNINTPSETTYNAIIIRMFKWIIGLSATQLAAILLFAGIANPTLILGIINIVYIPLVIWDIGRNWPTIEGGWSSSRFWAGTLGFVRIGFERPGLATLPWKAIFGLSAIYAIAQTLVQHAVLIEAGHEIALAIKVAAMMSMPWALLFPLAVVAAYGIGYLFGRSQLPTTA